ncbi:MAG: hypothetical protein LKH11_01620 [Solobacterium sp.]|jgi:hypothetical protein|nr:hypothetical protein [Solobacterium sp.]MCH4075596.1 hypothetical protein [Solobacterium sp.]MCI1313209.1 hypothetical protein [Solobacterium sp.]MCI1346680.1 hypothetical protein [Solobacterium sp.]MCI1435098.1 hypothetical protein [Solobacterium sp.]
MDGKTIVEYYEDVRKELKHADLESVMRGSTWKSVMRMIADKINSDSRAAGSESDIATSIDSALLSISQNIIEPSGNKPFDLKKEKSVALENVSTTTTRSKAIGRIDSKYSSVIIEYKKPAKYKTKADTDSALVQALDYLNSLYIASGGNYLGVITDGTRCQFVLFNEVTKAQYDADKYNVNPETMVGPLDASKVDRIIRSIIELQVKALTAENLRADLLATQNGKSLIYRLTYSLYESLKNMDSITSVSYGQWMNNFGLSHDDVSKQKAIEDRRRDLAKLIDREKIDTDEEYKILFALHTSIAILAMLIAYRVVSVVKSKRAVSFRELLQMNIDTRRIELNKIAEGSVSLDLRVFNLLEMGCYSWPFHEKYWTDKTNGCVTDIIEILMNYETMPALTSKTDDLFRDLYMEIMPISVRHSLGEYYTPGWLAENVINCGLGHLPYDKNNIRVIDTTAGSGTFIQKTIEKKREKYAVLSNSDILHHILTEVAAIDANTLAVILARINYFLGIADLIEDDDEIYIPVFIGDSTIPKTMVSDDKYYLDIIQTGTGKQITVKVPKKSTENKQAFIKTMQSLPVFAHDDNNEWRDQLKKLCTNEVELSDISDSWETMRNNELVTPAVINSMINSYLLCNIGKFDLIVGNPPWVDWKTLPSVHRENKKEICYERHLFSGDGRTGGNSLNICALISNISAENYLANGGVLALLMPQSILFQQSYEGYRKLLLHDGRKLYFQEIVDWSKSGHPFYPVQQLFCTYVISETKQDYTIGIPLKYIKLKKGARVENLNKLISEQNFNDYFSILSGVVGKASDSRSAFTYAANSAELAEFNTITGLAPYIGREGVEYYPQELQLLTIKSVDRIHNTVRLENYQSAKSKISVGKQTPEIETTYLRPLIKGINVSRFHVDLSEYVVAFPYDKDHDQVPLSKAEILERSPKLMNYYQINRGYLMAQTAYSDKIIGKSDAPYYSLARTGRYCHADWYVVFRDNTKWVAAVVGKIDTTWGGVKRPAFQNHCVSICERQDGSFITEDEAHYVCAILNSHIVENYILATSDKRTFKIRVPVKIINYDSTNETHVKLASLSKSAHMNYLDDSEIENIRNAIDALYLKTLTE